MFPFDVDQLARPGLLPFALPLVLYVVVLALLGRRRLKRTSFYIATLIRAAVAAALLFLIAGPSQDSVEQLPRRVEVHVDASASIKAQDRETWLAGLAAQLESLKDDDVLVDLYAFAGRPERIWSGPPGRFARESEALFSTDLSQRLDPMASNLQASLDLALPRRSLEESLGRVVFSDGVLPAPRRNDPWTPTRIMTPKASEEKDFSILNLAVTKQTEQGLDIRVTLTWSSTFSSQTSLVLAVDGEAMKTQDLEFEAGSGETSLAIPTDTLSAGVHRIRASLALADDELADNEATALFELKPQRRPLYLSLTPEQEPGPAVLRALRAQGLKPLVLSPGDLPVESLIRDHNLIVLDRVPAQEIGDSATSAILNFVDEGGGLLVLPRENNDELLAWNRHALGELLPLAGLPEPRIPPAREPEHKKPDQKDRKLSDPDPDKAKEKDIDAPTLVMLIVIDASASMKEGSRILYALRGAVATLRKLHPDDRIGVIAYNDQPMEVVPVQKVAAGEEIERAIMRIEPDGATDIEAALLFARQTLEREEAAVKTVILLSDGFSRPFNVKEVARSLLASGISVTTVGVGSEFDVPLLTQIAKFSGGTGPIPARNARQLPAVMVDVAARLIEHEGLRKAAENKSEKDPESDKISRPETRLDPAKERQAGDGLAPSDKAERIDILVDRAVSFLDGIPMAAVPPIRGLHRSQAKRGSSRSLKTEDGRTVLSYWRRGHGIVAMSALPFEGAWADQLPVWDAFSPLLSQLAHFLALDAEARPVDLQVDVMSETAMLEIFDGRSRAEVQGWTFIEDGQPLEAEDLGDGRYRLQFRTEKKERFHRIDAVDPQSTLVIPLGLTRPLPLEIGRRGVDLLGLQAWSQALAAEVQVNWNSSFVPDTIERRTQSARNFNWIWVFLGLLGLELALKRLTIRRSSAWT